MDIKSVVAVGYFLGSLCGERWSEEQRHQANGQSKLLHDGQTITAAGAVQGDPPRTDTLGFRWSAINNMFLTAGDVSGDEWWASRAVDEENAEREMRQFVWCLPVAPTKWDQISLEAHELAARMINAA